MSTEVAVEWFAELERFRAENERLRRLPTEEEIAEALFMRGSKDRFGKFASLNHDAKELWLGDARAVLALIEESRR